MPINQDSTSQPILDLGLTSSGQPVDVEAAKEFMKATLEKIEKVELNAVEAEMTDKARRLQAMVSPKSLPTLTEDQLKRLLRTIFATRRRANEILAAVGVENLIAAMRPLLYESNAVDARFQQFVETLSSYFDDVRVLRPKKSADSRSKQSAEEAALKENIFCDLGSELLHFTNPNEYWLWTRWLWDPNAGTGALPLVTMDEIDISGRTVGETYLKVGVAMAFVKDTGVAAGFAKIGSGPFGIDVFMVCVYAVYMYTTLRMRMTQEFNKVIPDLPQLIRRLLGVRMMEI